MSSKASGLVWDLECPKEYSEVSFRPSHKFVLLAYADHANHEGGNIWPAVKTISRKTGLDERTVQRLTNDLESIGLLVEDGKGPKGTNKWYLPYDDGGWHPAPLSPRRGDKDENSLGDIPSGDIPSGGTVPPELKEPEPLRDNKDKEAYLDFMQRLAPSVFHSNIEGWRKMRRRLECDDVVIICPSPLPQALDPSTPVSMKITGLSKKSNGSQFTEAAVFEDRYYRGFANMGLELEFTP